MKTIKLQTNIKASQEEIFDLTQDYSKRLLWDSYLKQAYLINQETKAKIGVDCYCKNHFGSVMISRYISFNRPHVAAVKMIKGPFILKSFSGAWNVKYLNDMQSKLLFTYNFKLKGGVIGRLISPLIIYIFTKQMKKRLHAIKFYLEKN